MGTATTRRENSYLFDMPSMNRNRTPLIFYFLVLLIGGVAIGGIYLYTENERSETQVVPPSSPMVYLDEKTNVNIPEDLHQFFESFSTQSDKANSKGVEHLDFDRFARELNRLGTLEHAGIGPENEADFREFSASLRKVGIKMPPVQGEGIEYHDFRWLKDHTEAIVVARHRLNAPVRYKTHLWVRWWLVREPHSASEWKIYDFEEIACGCRLSSFWSILAAGAKDHDRTRAEAIKGQVKKLLQIKSAIVFGEVDGVDFKLADFPLDRIPVELQTVLIQIKSLAFVEKARFPEALAMLETIASNERGSPVISLIKARAYLGLKDYEEALTNAKLFLAQVPDHERGEYCQAFALEQLGQTKEAAAGYERVLAISPDDPLAQAGWGRCLNVMKLPKKN
jgi:hypothetical protein